MAALSNQGDRIVRATTKSVTAYQLAELQKKDRKGKPITVKGLRQLWSIDPPAAGYSLIGYYAHEKQWLSLALTASIAIPVILALIVQRIQHRNMADPGATP